MNDILKSTKIAPGFPDLSLLGNKKAIRNCPPGWLDLAVYSKKNHWIL